MIKPLSRRILIHSQWPGWNCIPPRGVASRCAWRCGWSSSWPAGPSSPGEHTVTRMLVVWKTSFPPGRSSLAASGTQRAGSHHKLAPHSEMARSKLPEGSGISPASASTSREGDAKPVLAAPRGLELGGGHVHPDWPGAAPGQPGGEVRRPAAELDDIQAADVAEHAELLLGHIE